MSNIEEEKSRVINIDGEDVLYGDLSVRARSLIGTLMAVEQKENQHKMSANAYGVARQEYLADLKREVQKGKLKNEQSEETAN